MIFKFFTILIFALLLTAIPASFNGIKPSYLVLCILYLQFLLPQYFNVLIIFFSGLLLDVLLGTILGEHLFAILLTTFVASRHVRRFRFFPLGQQILSIFMLLIVFHLTIFLIEAFLGNNYRFYQVFMNALITALLWPWFKILIDKVFARHNFATV